jgi:hypothetical protein
VTYPDTVADQPIGSALRPRVREPWSTPRLKRLDADETAAGGLIGSDGFDSPSIS